MPNPKTKIIVDRPITLFHGSRGGIVGEIAPISRERCDFGRGFYMGTKPEQAKSLVANDQSPWIYALRFQINQVSRDSTLLLDGMDWAFFVLYNRGRLNQIKGTSLYQKYKHLADGVDVIAGPIADDAMNESMSRFIRNLITDRAFIESIRMIDYGVQYVAKTPDACAMIENLEERELYGKELDDALQLSYAQRKLGGEIADQMQKRYRREGRYFEEIIDEVLKTPEKEGWAQG